MHLQRYTYLGKDDETSLMGRGSYGSVRPAWDHRQEELVAVKAQAQNSDTAMREMMFFQVITAHPNLLRMLDMCVAENKLHLVFQ